MGEGGACAPILKARHLRATGARPIAVKEHVAKVARHASAAPQGPAARDNPAADASRKGDIDEVIHPLPCAVAKLGQGSGDAVVFDLNRQTEAGLQGVTQREVFKAGKGLRAEHPACAGIERPGRADAHAFDLGALQDGAGEGRDLVQDRAGARHRFGFIGGLGDDMARCIHQSRPHLGAAKVDGKGQVGH